MLLNFWFTKYRKHSPNIPISCTKLPRPTAHIINGRGNLEWIHIYKHQCYFYATGIPVPSLRFGTPLMLKGSFLILQRRFTPWNGLRDLAGSPLVVDQNINPTSKTKATFMVCPSDEEMKQRSLQHLHHHLTIRKLAGVNIDKVMIRAGACNWTNLTGQGKEKVTKPRKSSENSLFRASSF